MDRHRAERYADHLDRPDSNRNSDDNDRNFDNHRAAFSADAYHHRRQHHQHSSSNHRLHHSESNDSIGGGSGGDAVSGNSFSVSSRKRQFSHSGQGTSPDCIDGSGFVKLYVGAVPRTATEEDIRSLFQEHGNIVEIVLIKDKRTGQQQECCFVKYATLEEADRAIRALHSQYTFPGGMGPIKVKYADGERERLGGFGAHGYKLYVGCLNKQASKREIEEIFSPYGLVEDVYIVRDELKQSRGCAFVQFSHRDMAVAAINVLNGTYVMRACDQPLIVRFADPKKPRTAESRLTPNLTDPMGGHMQPNTSQPASPMGIIRSTQSPRIGSKPLTDSCTCTTLEPVLPSNIISAPVVPIISEIADPLDCDWSEHICPDGYMYYFNCVTYESRWEKPEEYTIYEQQLQRQQHPCQRVESSAQMPEVSHLQPSLPASEFNGTHGQAATSPVVVPACV